MMMVFMCGVANSTSFHSRYGNVAEESSGYHVPEWVIYTVDRFLRVIMCLIPAKVVSTSLTSFRRYETTRAVKCLERKY